MKNELNKLKPETEKRNITENGTVGFTKQHSCVSFFSINVATNHGLKFPRMNSASDLSVTCTELSSPTLKSINISLELFTSVFEILWIPQKLLKR